jgi:hypothetical protein
VDYQLLDLCTVCEGGFVCWSVCGDFRLHYRNFRWTERGRLKEKTVQPLGISHAELDTAFKLRGSCAPRNPKEAEQFGIKVVVVDIPRPPRNAIDVTPPETGGNGKPRSDNNGHD